MNLHFGTTLPNQRRFITMAQCTSSEATRHFSPAASLAALGVHLRQIDLFGPVRDTVKIAQKTVKYAPLDKAEAPWAYRSLWLRIPSPKNGPKAAIHVRHGWR